ncbi:FAD-dependent oxidoreductase [Sandaracinobacteroides hominis]|uniref:FAD-dependent oxidoreductase n=1 Tax=Sandaracinobacteroides hominis TaxID=2780086 RepID=UPI0018F71FAA|nr:FAD-dependent oxidoreductase [Sandaracinobacteroides hominis]
MSHILVVGGGIAGVTAATALAQSGFRTTLLEAAPQFGEIGAGVTLSPNAMKGLDFIGVMEEVASAGVEPFRQRIQHWKDGCTLVTMDRADQRGRYGAPYVYVHRADLHAILVEAAREAGVELVTNAAATRVEGTTVHTADGRRFSADAVIGSDGVKSVIRQRFEPLPAHFTGHVAWRALVPISPELAELANFPGVHIGPGKMVTRYPVRNKELLNLVFFARQPGWTDDGWTIRSDPKELIAAYDGWCDEVQAMIFAAAQGPLFKWAINARTPLPTWVQNGNVALIGDAAHAMTPFLGHGAACAIEDAVVLARALEASPGIAEGLDRFVAARHARATFIQAESNANADRMQGQETDMFGLGALRNEESLGLFDYDCRTVRV